MNIMSVTFFIFIIFLRCPEREYITVLIHDLSSILPHNKKILDKKCVDFAVNATNIKMGHPVILELDILF